MKGLIRAFDAADGLGWIDLEDGGAIRFGLSACKWFVPSVGATVEVSGVQEVLGRLKAVSVAPLLAEHDVEEPVWPEVLQEYFVEKRWDQGQQKDVRTRHVVFNRDAFAKSCAVWSSPADFTQLALAPASPADWANVPLPAPHPFFAPWHEGICATAIGALRLLPSQGGRPPAGAIGGNVARLPRAWPECPKAGHGPMTLLVSIAPGTFGALRPENATGIAAHACTVCLGKKHRVWLGAPSACAVVSVNRPSDALVTSVAHGAIGEVQLGMERIWSFPRSWLFQPRRDVKGHQPVEGPGSALFKVKLLRDRGASSPAEAYQEATSAYDAHYASPSDGLFVGGFSPFRYAPCPSCKQPMRQVFHLNDYFTGDHFGDLFGGSNELTLLACDRTAKCGGPANGLLVLDP